MPHATENRIPSLDGLRAISISLLLVGHLAGTQDFPLSREAVKFWNLGELGVRIFFVISGFCIHLFWAKARAAGVDNPVINFFSFWKRRVRRLYPPYFAALALYLCYIAYKTPVEVTGFYVWDVVLHLFMLHNLDLRTTYTINGAFWTLAIEEQLYLAYFLLLFLRIRYGWAKTLLLCFSARVVWLILARALSASRSISAASPVTLSSGPSRRTAHSFPARVSSVATTSPSPPFAPVPHHTETRRRYHRG